MMAVLSRTATPKSDNTHPGSIASDVESWNRVGAQSAPSWYLDPLVAAQKREVHVRLVQRAMQFLPTPRIALKTDLFEEAFGEDQILGDFPASVPILCAVDAAISTTSRVALRFPHLCGKLAAADLRELPFRDSSIHFILSTSSLDHFESLADLDAAIAELSRVLAPGGLLLITFDNPWNPLYHLLRLAGCFRLLPFPLGITPSLSQASAILRRHSLETVDTDWILHNPRGFSTLLFLSLRRLLRNRADRPISFLLSLFSALRHLPSRPLTACFAVTWARKTLSPDAR